MSCANVSYEEAALSKFKFIHPNHKFLQAPKGGIYKAEEGWLIQKAWDKGFII